MKDTKIYTELEIMSLPIIESYHKDLLIIDRDSINEAPTMPFIHSTGKYGTILTHLIPAMNYPMKDEKVNILFGQGGRDNVLKNIISSVEYIKRSDKKDLVVYFDGVSLHRISPEHAIDIASTYKLDIKHQWVAGEIDQKQNLIHHFEWLMGMNQCKSIEAFKSSLQACYSMRFNPAPKLRKWYGIGFVEYSDIPPDSFEDKGFINIFIWDKGKKITIYGFETNMEI